ncbi:MAG: hypothetical protein GF370_02785 [Candidatus Nealsonbacteria bacterium]|nr:hypothetical protein [Candidatus Nealsonbacteria bacterium]
MKEVESLIHSIFLFFKRYNIFPYFTKNLISPCLLAILSFTSLSSSVMTSLFVLDGEPIKTKMLKNNEITNEGNIATK